MTSTSSTASRSRRAAALSATVALVLGACSAAYRDDAAVDPGGDGAGQAAAGPAAAPAAIACGTGESLQEHPDWPLGGGDAEIVPLLVSSLVAVGPNRLLYTVADADLQVLASAEMATTVSLYALERDPLKPVATVEGRFLETPLGKGLYRAAVDFDCVGEWGLELTAELDDGSIASERMRFTVHASGTTPALGDPAPRSESPTADRPDELRLVSTDPDPYPAAYERTVEEVVTAGQPSLVFFATPSFCQTGFCGPTVDLVKSVAVDYAGRVGFVTVEPYELQVTENGLQPALDAGGQLQPVQAALDYGIPVEPYLFVVDAGGDVFAKFEGVVGEDELRAAIEDALAQAA